VRASMVVSRVRDECCRVNNSPSPKLYEAIYMSPVLEVFSRLERGFGAGYRVFRKRRWAMEVGDGGGRRAKQYLVFNYILNYCKSSSINFDAIPEALPSTV
jgi:hypothetical protein